MEALSHHFKQHGAVHAFWGMSLLVLIISALLIRLPQGDRVNDFISFSSSLSSLLLAVVAIFYSFISNDNVARSSYAMQAAVDGIKPLANSITESAKQIDDRAVRISAELLDIRPAVNEIRERVSSLDTTAPSTPASDDVARENQESTPQIMKGRSSIGTSVALFALAKASKLGIKSIQVKEMFNGEAIWQNYTGGVFAALETLQPCGIVINYIKDSTTSAEESGMLFEIDSFPIHLADSIIDRVNHSEEAGKDKYVDKVMEYLKGKL